MTPAVVALCIAVSGLLAVLAWHLFRPLRNLGRDVGLAVFHEDEMDDLEELYRLPAAERDGAE